jgi:hypothetical protein
VKIRWLVPVLALLSAGCIKEKMLVVVNPDGSGNIVLDTAMTAEAAAMMQQTAASFAGAFGETNAAASAAPAETELIKEEDLRERAAEFGEGVEFVRLKRTTEGGGKGAIAVYSFKDINKVRLPMKQGAGGPGGQEEAEDAKPPKAVTFALTGADTKKLTINVPQEEKKAEAAAAPKPKIEGAPEGLENMAASMMAPMMQMFKGLEMSMAVQVKGDVVKTTASHAQGDKKDRAVLMEMKFDELMKSPNFAKIFEKSQGEDMPTADLVGMPGFTFETKPSIEIEFK